ncbi:glycosyltransferase family 2 protein [Flavobacterium sp. 3-218]
MKVSACLITYNHEDYIVNCIEGALSQIVDFDYEIVIGEDKSTDKTLKICEEYAFKYPDKIRLIKRDTNLGMMANWIETMKSCQGKYIAICEGDDYWSDSLKLQKQVDILENNPNLMGSFHNSEERYWNDYTKASALYLDIRGAREVSLQDMTNSNMVPTASIVFRSPVPNEVFTDAFLNLPICDWPLHLLNLKNGNYYYIPQVMSVRHLYLESTWGMQDEIRNRNIVLNTYDLLINSNWFSLNIIQNLKKGKDNLSNPGNSFLKTLKYRCKLLLHLLTKW